MVYRLESVIISATIKVQKEKYQKKVEVHDHEKGAAGILRRVSRRWQILRDTGC